MTEYRVVCTGKNTHGALDFPPLEFDDGNIDEQLSRYQAAPWSSDATINFDGEVFDAPIRTTVRAVSHMRIVDGSERWEWSCKKCRVNLRLRGDNLRRWIAATDGDTLDISLLS